MRLSPPPHKVPHPQKNKPGNISQATEGAVLHYRSTKYTKSHDLPVQFCFARGLGPL